MLPRRARPAVAEQSAVMFLPAPAAMFAAEDRGCEMKIAVISEDGNTISQHFGRAPYFVVLTIEEGQIVDKEIRPKAGHTTFAAHEPPKLAPGERHGYDAGAQSRHAEIAEVIQDCQVLLNLFYSVPFSRCLSSLREQSYI